MSNGKSVAANVKTPPAETAAAKPPTTPTVKTPPLFRPIDWLTFLVTTGLVFLGYLLTLAPDLTLEDSGELAVASHYAGIPHPPGYPVWTMYTWLFAKFLPFYNIAWRVAVGSAFAGAVGSGLLALLVSRGSSMMMEGIEDLKNIGRRWENLICVISGYVAGMLLGFNGYMWSQSVIVEVYSFSVVSLMCVMLFLLRWVYAPHQYRYLYLAFFSYGICFNNHQSLLVISMGMEVLVLTVDRKVARDLFFWNTVAYIGGLVASEMQLISTLKSNVPVYVIFNLIGLGSAALWIWLSIITKKRFIEIARDTTFMFALGLPLVIILLYTSWVPLPDPNGPLFILCVVEIGLIAGLVWLIKTARGSWGWLIPVGCGASFMAGAAFYLYMAVAGMSIPPMQWGYPRIVEGFFHALTRGQYEKIHPTGGTGDNIVEIAISFFKTYAQQLWMYFDGAIDEFNLVYILLAVVMFLFYRKMQKRERAWTLGVLAIFICLGPFLVVLLNPPPERAARELIRVFFTASHAFVAMGVGYGLTLVAATLVANYEKIRKAALVGGLVVVDIALFALIVNGQKMISGGGAQDVGSIDMFLKFILVTLTFGSLAIILQRLFFSDTDPRDELHPLIALGSICLVSFIITLELFNKAIWAVDQSTVSGLVKLLCWLLAGICFYFGGRQQKQEGRTFIVIVGAVASLLSVLLTLLTMVGDSGLGGFFHMLGKAFSPGQFALPVYSAMILLGMALVYLAAIFVFRRRAPLAVILALFAIMPMHSLMSHWFENEQRGHMFGYWFGHDMFTPPFNGKDGKPLYPEMTRDAVLYGGTDPGRFCPTYMIFSESFVPPECKKNTDPNFDRRDVYIITQNALADGTYLNYIRSHYDRSAQKDPPFFQELLRGPKEQEQGYQTNLLAKAAYALLDRPFLKLGDSIEKDRRVGSSFFKETDFVDVTKFAGRLREKKPVSTYVFDALTPETQKLLSGGDEKVLKKALTADLNVLLERELKVKGTLAEKRDALAELETDLTGIKPSESQAKREQDLRNEIATLEKAGSLYETARFKDVALSETTVAFARQNPQSHTRIRLNRLLLEETYAGLIAKSPGGVYPDREIYIASPADSQRCFSEYMADAQRRLQQGQLRPGEDVRVVENRVQVSGQVAVMAINGLLTKVMFDANPTHEFFVEESFPLDWMYPHLTPFGVIMKINRQPLPALTEEIYNKDHEFWTQFSERLIGNWINYDTPVTNIAAWAEKVYLRRDFSDFKGDPKFVRDDQAQKAFSKLRSSIGGVYAWRLSPQCPPEYRPKTQAEVQRLLKEADFTFRQSFAFCPYSPEAVFRYAQLLMQLNRVSDALVIAETCLKLDPYNQQVKGLVENLRGFQQQSTKMDEAGKQLKQMENEAVNNPTNFQALFNLAIYYLQTQETNRAVDTLDKVLESPHADASAYLALASAYVSLQNIPKLETTLEKLVKVMPNDPEPWYDLAALKVSVGKPSESLAALTKSLDANAKRQARDPKANDLMNTLRADARFNSVRGSPEFQKLMAGTPPPGTN